MGYATYYSLKLTQLDNEVQTVEKTIDGLIADVKNNKLDQSKLIEQLNQVKNGYVNVDEDYILKDLRNSNQEARYALSENGASNNNSKWYECKEDLKEFSKKYPNWLFTLSGEGEQSGDIWKAYFVNGKVQLAKARIVIDEFNPKELS